MATTESQTTLEHAAESGSIEVSAWPRLLEDLLQRLHNIVHNEFPIPQIPASSSSSASKISSTPPPLPDLLLQPGSALLPVESQQSTKENDEPATETTQSTLPPELLSLYQSSVHILERDFAQSPPYTVQRLSELVLQPRRYYRYLPAYLRALDRVISVSSPVSDFPLPTGVANGGFLTNGDLSELSGIQEREGLGSDESLGGALLTPIPWLRNAVPTEGEFHSERMDTIMGPNGAGSIETVSVTMNGIPSTTTHTSPNTSTPASPTLSEQSDASTNSSGSFSTEAQLREQGGVTQGELLRQEQEAGVIPIAQMNRRLLSVNYADAAREPAPLATDVDAAEDLPHARGPDVIGMEDTGMVANTSGLDIEAAVGRSKSPQPPAEQNDGEAAVD